MFGLAERDHMFHPRDFLQVFFSHDPRHESHAAINRKIPFSPPSLSRFLSPHSFSFSLSLSPNYICVIARVRAPTCVCVCGVHMWIFGFFFFHFFSAILISNRGPWGLPKNIVLLVSRRSHVTTFFLIWKVNSFFFLPCSSKTTFKKL
jgi:hypothetical protein